MDNYLSSIPIDIQLQAVCAIDLVRARDLMAPYAPELHDWKLVSYLRSHREQIKKYFTFTPSDLISFLGNHPQICKSLMVESSDKRYAPSTFIDGSDSLGYRVGWVNASSQPVTTQIHVFRSTWEAVADYVLFSWDLPRLTKEHAEWHEYEIPNYRDKLPTD